MNHKYGLKWILKDTEIILSRILYNGEIIVMNSMTSEDTSITLTPADMQYIY